MRITLVVTTFNRKDALALVLASALAQERPPDELVVADDGSTRDTAEAVAAFAARAPFPVHHAWQEDLGFRAAASRNRAFAAAAGDYLVMVDGDIVLHPAFLADHQRAALPGRFVQGSRVLLSEAASAAALASGRVRFGPCAPGVRNRLNAVRNPLLSRLVSHAGSDVFRVRSANLACWRSDVLAVNGFDEDFVGWGREDSEFVARLQHSGLTRLHLKLAAIGYHLWHPEASRQALPQNQRILEETLATRRIRCVHGIDRHLGGAAYSASLRVHAPALDADCRAAARLPAGGARTAQEPRREQEDAAQEPEHPVDRHPQHPEGQQEEPDERVEEQGQERQRPADHQQEEPEQEGQHAPAYALPDRLFHPPRVAAPWGRP